MKKEVYITRQKFLEEYDFKDVDKNDFALNFEKYCDAELGK